MASLEENEALVRRLIDAINDDDDATLTRLIAPGFVHRNPADPQTPPGPEGPRQMGARGRRAFPDGRDGVEDQIAEGDQVITRWTFHGTHRGELMGVAPTGKAVAFDVIDIVRVHDGRMCEHWNVVDQLSLLRQLRVVS